MKSARNEVQLSVVSPMYNEEKNVSEIVERLLEILNKDSIKFEIILVDDGSSDETWREIKSSSKRDHRVRGLRLSKNYGQMKALEQGLRKSKGNYILTIDGDGQHPIEKILEMWKVRSPDYIVAGKQVGRNEKALKSFLSRKFYRLLRWISGLSIEEDVGDFRLIPRNMAELILEDSSDEKVFRFLIAKYGILQITIPFQANKRQYGKSSYSFSKMLKLAYQSTVNLTTRPLYLSVILSFLFASISSVLMLFAFLSYVFLETAPGWSSLIAIVGFGFTAILLVLGIMSIYLKQLFESMRRTSPNITVISEVT